MSESNRLLSPAVFSAYNLPLPEKTLPVENGLVNDSFVLVYPQRKLFLQNVNAYVFKDVEAVMENVSLASAHLEKKGSPALKLVKTASGSPFLRLGEGFWRIFHYVEGVSASEAPKEEAVAVVAEAFGRFHKDLADFPSKKLKPSIEGFHRLPNYLAAFDEAKRAASKERLSLAKESVEAFEKLKKPTISLFEKAWRLPLRTIHADAKAENVLLNGQSALVVDYDTLMTAPLAYDQGDLIRSLCSRCKEDEDDLSLAKIDVPLLALFLERYLAAVEGFVAEEEVDFLLEASRLVLYELGLRFLTDYLNQDRYFKTKDPLQNLRRAQTQLSLLQSWSWSFGS